MSTRSFTLTIWNHDKQDVMNKLKETFMIQYAIMANETCPDTQRKHVQGFMLIHKRMAIAKVRKEIIKSIPAKDLHLEAARGAPQMNRTYCIKDHDFLEEGQCPIQGKRTDLDQVVSAIKAGTPLDEIWTNHTIEMIKYYKGIEMAIKRLRPNHETPQHALDDFKWEPITDWTTSHVFWGNTGIGKTQFALAILPRALFVTHIDQLVAYSPDSYDGIIFDDMAFTHYPREPQIHLCDIDQDRAINVKHSIAIIPRGTKKIFTTNIPNGCIFMNDPAIARRITIHHLE